jgi:hypothetical protein
MQNHYEAPESIEARAIMRLVELGTTTLEDARDLIAIKSCSSSLRSLGKKASRSDTQSPSAAR